MNVKCLRSLGIGNIPYILIEFFQLCTWFSSVYVFLSFSLTYFSNYGICTGISVLTWELSESLKPNPRNCRGWSFNKPSADSKVSDSLLYAPPCRNSLHEGPFFSGFLVTSLLFYVNMFESLLFLLRKQNLQSCDIILFYNQPCPLTFMLDSWAFKISTPPFVY